jgi:hypothetical protein
VKKLRGSLDKKKKEEEEEEEEGGDVNDNEGPIVQLSIQLLSSRFCLGRFLKLKEFSMIQTPDFDFFNQTQMGER